MLDRGPEVQAQTLDEAKALGADLIRANVIWARVRSFSDLHAGSRKASTPRSPTVLSGATLAMFDSLVAGAQARGMQVLLTPTGPIPAWASRCKGSVATAQGLQARPEAVRRLRARPRRALPDRQVLVDLERAEPRLLAEPAVRGRRRRRPSSARPRCTARSPSRRSPRCAPPATAPRPTRSGSARRRRWATTRPAAAPSAACACPRAARSRSRRPRRRRSCAACSACPRAAARSAAPKARIRAARATRSSASTATRTIRTRAAARVRRCRRPTPARSRSAWPRG